MNKTFNQEDLFEVSQTNDLQYKIKELDNKIRQSLKDNNYKQAKKLTDIQKQYIEELVNLTENKNNANI